VSALNAPTELSVLVDGIADHAVAAEIENTVRALFRETRAAGKWIVAIAPSDTRGRWDVGLKGPFGRHISSFAASPDQVAAFTAQHLRRTLARIVR
jgi:hypothetical protein